MSQASIQTVDMLRAAGEPTRLRILALLASEELSVLELCRILDQSQPRVSRHLKLLAEAGLVDRFPDGAWVFYRLTAAAAGRLSVVYFTGPHPDTVVSCLPSTKCKRLSGGPQYPPFKAGDHVRMKMLAATAAAREGTANGEGGTLV
jgi:DNA-binding transcriptional ArsR family regulator